MNKLIHKVLIARRRLALQRFLKLAPWCCFVALLLAAALVGVNKYVPLGLKEWAWPAIGAVAGLVAAAGLTWLRGQTVLDAAVEIDRRFGLKERVSSAFALSPEQRESPIGQALIDDAIRGVSSVEVGEKFRLSMNRWALLPLAPGLAAFLIILFLHPSTDAPQAVAETVAARQQVKKASEVLNRQAAERLKEAREKEVSKATEELLTKLEQGTKQMIKGEDDKRQAMVKLNDLNKEMEKRQQDLQGGEKLKEQLEQLKNLAKGPADKLGDALRNGDVKQAAKELKALKEQLQDGKLDAEQKAQLAKQLENMQEKLNAMAEKQEKLADELKQQIAEKRAAGKGKEADELEKKLQKLADQMPQEQQKKLKEMAQKLGQCAQCAKQGDGKGAVEAMEQLEQQLNELQDQLAEAGLLNEALDQLAEAKEAMACKQCNGQGCAACKGNGNKPGSGNGLGKGQGQGERPENENKTATYDTKVKQQTGKGASTITDRVEGPNVKGRVEQEIQTQFESVRGASADPLADTKLPRGYRDHARKYFDSLREGDQSESTAKPEQAAP